MKYVSNQNIVNSEKKPKKMKYVSNQNIENYKNNKP